MADAPDREFAVFQRGEVRELILALFRNALRSSTNPDTGATFTEEEIAVATAKGSKKWVEADSDDIVALTDQQRALWLADQVRIDHAGTSWLREHHGRMWGESYLQATGSSGPATATGTPGTVYVGSTTIPDPAAHYATDPAGLRYQVLTTVTADGAGDAALELGAIDTGTQTNIATGTVLTWASGPVGAASEFLTTDDFDGGTDDETDAEFAKRLLARIRHKPASGNVAHFRAWAREASNAVEDAFVFACALHAGSVIVCVTQKRAGTSGPEQRIPNLTTLSDVTSYIVPPQSAVVPAGVLVLIVAPVSEPSNVLVSLSMAKGRDSGWADLVPWPTFDTTVSSVTQKTSSTLFRIHSDSALPTGVTAPSLMLWNPSTSRFESLHVSGVTSVGGGVYEVTLSQAPSYSSFVVGDYVSPDTERRVAIAEAAEEYFDSLGPGEVIDLETDTRAHRAFRFPEPFEEWPQIAGSVIATTLQDALGAALASADLISMSSTSPTVPSDPIGGPSLITLGKLAVYSV